MAGSTLLLCYSLHALHLAHVKLAEDAVEVQMVGKTAIDIRNAIDLHVQICTDDNVGTCCLLLTSRLDKQGLPDRGCTAGSCSLPWRLGRGLLGRKRGLSQILPAPPQPSAPPCEVYNPLLLYLYHDIVLRHIVNMHNKRAAFDDIASST